MKVWLLLSRLGRGGLERVQINLASAMLERNIDVTIVAGQIEDNMTVNCEKPLTVVEIAKNGRRHFIPGLLRSLGRDTPRVVFTTSNDVACLVLILRRLCFRDMRVIVTQHLSLSGPMNVAGALKSLKQGVIHIAMRLLLPKADAVVAVSHMLALDMRNVLRLPELPIHVIHNPIVGVDFEHKATQTTDWPWSDQDSPTVIFVGRLSTEKRLDLLVEAFANLLNQVDARLLIVGAGPLQDRIATLIDKLGLQPHCRLIGFKANVLPFIRKADLLVLSSDYEGFGNVLVEAMGCGTQVISTDCPYGPAEILCGGVFGQLVPMNDPVALELAMRRSLLGTFTVPREQLIARANDFGLQRSADRYIALLDQM